MRSANKVGVYVDVSNLYFNGGLAITQSKVGPACRAVRSTAQVSQESP